MFIHLQNFSLLRRTAPLFVLPVATFLLISLDGFSVTAAEHSAEELAEELATLRKSLTKQEKLLERLQMLTAEQLQRGDELEQTIPPRDLLDSLQNGFSEIRQKTQTLEKRITELSKQIKSVEKTLKTVKPVTPKISPVYSRLVRGLLSLQAGNPDQAVEYLQSILKQKAETTLKGEILTALGHSFLAQGHPRQAASYYGTLLREFPESPYVPPALYFLGEAMATLDEEDKRKVLWEELLRNFPKHPLAKRVKQNKRE